MNNPKTNDYTTLAMQISNLKHGGNVYANAKKLNLLPSEIIDASASLVPFDPPQILIDSINAEIKNLGFRYYPERNLSDLKEICLLYTSPSPRDQAKSRMPSSA